MVYLAAPAGYIGKLKKNNLLLQQSVAVSGVCEQWHNNDVSGERGALLPAAAVAPDVPVAARPAPPHGHHIPRPRRTGATTPGERWLDRTIYILLAFKVKVCWSLSGLTFC